MCVRGVCGGKRWGYADSRWTLNKRVWGLLRKVSTWNPTVLNRQGSKASGPLEGWRSPLADWIVSHTERPTGLHGDPPGTRKSVSEEKSLNPAGLDLSDVHSVLIHTALFESSDPARPPPEEWTDPAPRGTAVSAIKRRTGFFSRSLLESFICCFALLIKLT